MNTATAAAVVDGIGGGDERVADRNHFVAGADADREQRQVERGRAVGDGARVRCAHLRGELPLERGDLRTLRHPP